MDTLKTAIVVVLLLAVLYGVYVTLNQPDQEVSEEIAWAQQESTAPLQVDFGTVTGGIPSGVTASLGDSTPAHAEHTHADMHGHEHAAANATQSTQVSAAAPGPVSPPATPVSDAVAAPQLVSSGGGTTFDAEPNSQANANPTYPSPPAELASRGSESGFGGENSLPSQQVASAAALQTAPANSNTSVYAPAPSTAAPSGGYGASSELAGNTQMVAAAEPPVADSYGALTAASSTTFGPSTSPVVPEPQSGRIRSALDSAKSQVEQEQFYEALYTLSLAYDAPGVSPGERQQLQSLLDPLAGKVIYSKEHLIGPAHQIQAGETLQSVATKYKVPWQLLANINGFRDPAAVQPGTSIKVVPGPFHAEVDVTNSVLTLFAGKLYAGRFAVRVNSHNPPAAGEYQVNDKQPGHSFYAGNAQTLAPQDPQNPYGGIWIDLGGNVSIHGTSSAVGQSDRLGCISLEPQDANDLYGILSRGSNVIIRR